MVTVHVYAKIYNYPVLPRARRSRSSFSRDGSRCRRCSRPFIIVGGILLGLVHGDRVRRRLAVIYAAVLSIFIYRELDMKQLYPGALRAIPASLAAVALFSASGPPSAFGWPARVLPDSPRAAARPT